MVRADRRVFGSHRWAVPAVALVALAMGSAVLVSPAAPAPAAQAAVASSPVLGSLTPLDYGLNGAVNALAWDETASALYAAGDFDDTSGVSLFSCSTGSLNCMATWDGSAWSGLGGGVAEEAYSLAWDQDDTLYVGGSFYYAGPTSLAASQVAAWSYADDTWTALGAGLNDNVFALAVDPQDGTLYAGGEFDDSSSAGAGNCSNGGALSCIAAWDGSAWSSLGTGLSSSVRALALDAQDDTLYAGGSFQNAGGDPLGDRIAAWSYADDTWHHLGTGLNSSVRALALDAQDETLYVGGQFDDTGANSRTTCVSGALNCIAKWNGSSWSALGTGTDAPVWAIGLDSARDLVYAGGFFALAGGQAASRVAVWDAGMQTPAWIPLRWGSADDSNGVNGTSVVALALDDSTVYLGGDFTNAGNNPLGDYIAKWTWDEPSGSLSALSGDPGDMIDIEGWGLIGVTGVTFDYQPTPHSHDDSTTITDVVVPSTPGTYTVRVKAVGSTTAAGTVIGTFTVNGSAPIPPVYPPSAPRDVTAVPGDRSATVTWTLPTDSGSYPVTNYEVRANPGGATCLVAAPTTSCTIEGLTNGTAYTFEVRALSGAGWGSWSGASSPVTPTPSAAKSILITGSRTTVKDRPGVKATGTTVGLAGTIVQARVHVAGELDYFDGSVRTVGPDGTFTWQRKTGKKVYVFFRSLADPEVRSNRVVIPAA